MDRSEESQTEIRAIEAIEKVANALLKIAEANTLIAEKIGSMIPDIKDMEKKHD
jgi:hypothetical protein